MPCTTYSSEDHYRRRNLAYHHRAVEALVEEFLGKSLDQMNNAVLLLVVDDFRQAYRAECEAFAQDEEHVVRGTGTPPRWLAEERRRNREAREAGRW